MPFSALLINEISSCLKFYHWVSCLNHYKKIHDGEKGKKDYVVDGRESKTEQLGYCGEMKNKWI